MSDYQVRQILMSAPMVRALLSGTKTQTRRICKAAKDHDDGEEYRDTDGWPLFDASADGCGDVRVASPYGVAGDQLWVRETWGFNPDHPGVIGRVCYRADPGHRYDGIKWKPSIHMPRLASRITLEVTEVRVERLQDISIADCIAEGIPRGGGIEKREYRELWERINGASSWDANPWVWVVSFRRLP